MSSSARTAPSPAKTAFITGAAQRIGAEITRELHSRGYNIVLHYRSSAQPVGAVADSLNAVRPDSARCVQADLTDHQQVLSLAHKAQDCFGRIDVLINNASTFYPTPANQATEADWQVLMDSNVKGPFFLSQALTGELTARGGTIINIVDIHCERPMRDHTIYSIAKAGVAMMTKTLAKELAPAVRVNGVSPGAILWPKEELAERHKKSIVSKVPLQRTGTPGDIARTVAFLVDDAPYISGQIIAVDGGRSLSM